MTGPPQHDKLSIRTSCTNMLMQRTGPGLTGCQPATPKKMQPNGCIIWLVGMASTELGYKLG